MKTRKIKVKRATTSSPYSLNDRHSSPTRIEDQEGQETGMSNDETYQYQYQPPTRGYLNYSPLDSKIEIMNMEGNSQCNASAIKKFLFKRAASQQSLLSQIPRHEYLDTPDTYLTPLQTNRESLPIVHDQNVYKFIPQSQPKYKGVILDEDGNIMKRKILGSEQIYKQIEYKHKASADLKLLSKQTYGSSNARSLINKNRTVTLNTQEFSRDGGRDIYSVRSKTLQSLKHVKSHDQHPQTGRGNSNQLNDTLTHSSPSRTKKINKFIKFPDQNMKEMIMSIYDRVRNNSEVSTIQNYTQSNASWKSTLSRVSTVGGLLKEIQQERTLKKHADQSNGWDFQALKLNQRIFSDKRVKKTQSKLSNQDESKFQSVMMRDNDYIDKVQALNAISHLRDLQHMNQNVGWIFQLRQSNFDTQRKSQQYLPCTNNSNINAVIVPQKQQVTEITCKQDFNDIEAGEASQDQSIIQFQNLNVSEFDKTLLTNKTIQFRDSRYSTQNQAHRLNKIKSESKFMKWESYQSAWKKEGPEITKVLMGTNLENIKGLKLQGQNVLQKEIEHCASIPNDKRLFVLNHHLTNEGEGEPPIEEEIIAEDYQKQYGF